MVGSAIGTQRSGRIGSSVQSWFNTNFSYANSLWKTTLSRVSSLAVALSIGWSLSRSKCAPY
jgi:hypothetical protein